VIVADGTYSGPGNRDIDFKGSAITIRSENGPGNCIIDCTGTEIEPHRGFYFHNGEEADSILEGFTITNGYGGLICEEYGCVSCGGGIYCHKSSPTIDNCTINSNAAGDHGGGMYNFDGSNPTLNNCTFSGNSADSFGGGMYNRLKSNPTLTNCTFSDNSATWGGGMANEDNSSPILTSCIFSDNSATVEGGGMSNVEKCSAVLTNCTFSGNWAGHCGGGLSNEHSSPRLSECNFSDNSADFFGGGMSYNSSGSVLSNCIFSCNRALFGGGMSDVIPIWGVDSLIQTNYKFSPSETDESRTANNTNSPNLINCTFNSNSANHGGAMSNLNLNSGPALSNCILWGDTPNEIYILGKAPIVTYCNVEGGFSGEGNIDSDPCFVDTDIGSADFHLRSQAGRWDPINQVWVRGLVTSPCIDAGDPDADRTAELWPHGKRINMGAFGGTPEASMSLLSIGNIADLNTSGLVDYADIIPLSDKWLCEQVLLSEDLDRNGFVNFTDFAIFAQNWLSIEQ
jgi:hypothetical protein